MGTQATSYITREAAIAICKRKLKEKGWWKISKGQVKSMSDEKLGNLLDRLVDSHSYNFIVIDQIPEERERLTHYIDDPNWDTQSTGYYLPLKLADVIGSIRERYERISKSDWFIDAYKGKSLEINNLLASQTDMTHELVELINDHFWELVEGKEDN